MMDDATRFATLRVHFAPMALIHIRLSHRYQIQIRERHSV